MSTDNGLDVLKERVAKLEVCYTSIQDSVTKINISIELLKANYDSTKLIIQWIVFPLVVILGGLVGIKILFPSV